MGLAIPASVECDKCGEKAVIRVALTKLKPHAEMHLVLPEGWAVSSLPESGELFITCPNCPPTLVTARPVPAGDPASAPTILPAPPGASSR
jgi:hypothetical protein